MERSGTPTYVLSHFQCSGQLIYHCQDVKTKGGKIIIFLNRSNYKSFYTFINKRTVEVKYSSVNKKEVKLVVEVKVYD